MSGRGDSEISETGEEQHAESAQDVENVENVEEVEKVEDLEDLEDPDDPEYVARRARWTAAGSGALLALAGLAAAVLRVTGSAPALVPAAYAFGAGFCAFAAFLGSRGRTRRALWVLVAGVMVMAFGDQFD
ncbi:hypothetical protein [Streptomyces chartreusis]|uniref:hypothetical protein n=1 Tax=Streptomyces chartreusis TaxID=1969 RepID=UPI0036A4B188